MSKYLISLLCICMAFSLTSCGGRENGKAYGSQVQITGSGQAGENRNAGNQEQTEGQTEETEAIKHSMHPHPAELPLNSLQENPEAITCVLT